MLVGVDGGADAIIAEGFRPDMILGDMDSATDAALTCGAEVVVHAYADGGRTRASSGCSASGSTRVVAPAIGTSQDVAMLLAHENGAELIVSVGAHFNLTEFLDKNRAGHVVHVPDPAADRRDAGRCQGREPPLQPGRSRLAHVGVRGDRRWC